MATYENYKDSGVKWLGQIPSHWEIIRMRNIFQERNQKGFPDEQLLSATQSKGVIPQSLYENRVVEATKSLETLKLVKVGDFVISLRSFQGGIEYAYFQGIISPAYTVLSLRNSHYSSSYFKFLLKCKSFINLLTSYVTGIRQGQNIDYGKLKYDYIPIPPIAEQEAIVEYLDKVTADIDRAIEAQQKMIDALNERKQIIITRAVTRGMGRWESYPLRFVFELRGGYTPSKSDPTLWENGTIPWYRMEDIRRSGRLLDESIQKVNSKALKSKGLFKAGSYIMAICTASIGEHAMLIADSLANQRFMNLEVHKSLISRFNPLFLFYYFFVIGQFCRDNANSTCFQYVDMPALKRYPIPIPSIEEQNEIVKHIEANTSALNKAIEDVRKKLDLLQERKQIIINEVVTGKKKVI